MRQGLFDRDEVCAALEALTDELIRREVRARIRILGGAAMALDYDLGYAGTTDVDAALAKGSAAVLDAARAVAFDRGYPEDWLNDNARIFYPPGGRQDSRTFLDRDGVTITVASAETLLAMKLLAGRPNRDFGHIANLIEVLGLRSAGEIEQLYEEHYPGEALKDHVRGWVMNQYS